jgi:ABC-type dipeptide/oligopeptide/nickel transport system permease subunit
MAEILFPERRWRLPDIRLLIGGGLLAVFVVLAIIGPLIAPYDPNAQDLMAALDPPSASHWLGADQIGRDILSRLIVGTRYTLSITVVSVAAATVIGVALGSIGAFFGGYTDRILTGFVDLLLTIPNLVLAIALAAVVGATPEGLAVAITASFVPSLAILVRSRVLELREEDFVSAAVTVGTPPFRVLLRHILPNTISIITIETSLLAGQAVLVGSALGFLGLGVQPPASEWGAMLGESREALEVAPHLVIAPGIAISLLVFAFNTLGDGLRDRFDPKM